MDKMKLMEGEIYVLFFFIYLSEFQSSESLRPIFIKLIFITFIFSKSSGESTLIQKLAEMSKHVCFLNYKLDFPTEMLCRHTSTCLDMAEFLMSQMVEWIKAYLLELDANQKKILFINQL